MTVARINPDLVSAFCATCKRDVMVGPSLTCPQCGEEVDHTSLAVMPKRVPAEAPKPGGRAAVLPRIRAAVQLDGALDAVLVALEKEERAAQDAYEAAKHRYRMARQALADARQLRGLVKVAGDAAPSTTTSAAAADGKRWSRKHDACIDCGTTERKHASKGRCTRCNDALRRPS